MALLLLSACGRDGHAQPAGDPPRLGSAALVERTPEQFQADLDRLRGRVVVVNFWASWCAPCREELPALQRVARDYAGRPVTIIGIDASDVRTDALGLLRRGGVTFPTVFDAKGLHGGIASKWSVTGLPQTWFVAKDGTRSSRSTSAIQEQDLRSRIDELLVG